MAGVTLNGVTKRFGDVVAVKEANLEVRDKEFLVLVGPSGCGKSTTLRMIAGLEEISDGVVKIGDRVVNDIPPKDRDIAMVFQNYALYPHMDVYDNMAFGLKLRKIDGAEIRQRVEEAAKILGIEKLLHRKPKQLSGGQKQRVALGRAIVRKPKVFLMDEPLSNLDAKLRVQMRAELSKLHDRLQTTVIYVTHDQTEAMTMGDRIVVLKDGIVQQVDDPLTLYNHPTNIFVAGFIGSPAMNFLDCVLKEEGGTLYMVSDSFKIKVPEEKVRDYPKIRERLDKRVIMGIRPEDLNDVNLEAETRVTEANIFTAEVEVVEPMGSESYLYLAIDGKSIVARVAAESKAAVGDKIKVVAHLHKLHIFAPGTEEAYF
ncbi:MAG: sn-glycerol-3-phosphate ABC transporter ATP-binding protein UgpC [Halanaerobium sp.]|nr:sn-glycerol-3-phosphate ABC transporter ATP-binding protein UgpC [Halanaerobium sp.]